MVLYCHSLCLCKTKWHSPKIREAHYLQGLTSLRCKTNQCFCRNTSTRWAVSLSSELTVSFSSTLSTAIRPAHLGLPLFVVSENSQLGSLQDKRGLTPGTNEVLLVHVCRTQDMGCDGPTMPYLVSQTTRSATSGISCGSACHDVYPRVYHAWKSRQGDHWFVPTESHTQQETFVRLCWPHGWPSQSSSRGPRAWR